MRITDQIMKESRKNLRVRENLRVKWQVQNSNINGKGRILNVSTSGLLLEANQFFSPVDKCIIAIDSLVQGAGNFLPVQGRLVWSRRATFRRDKIVCGVEFINPTRDILEKLRERVQSGISKLTNFRKIKSVVGVLLVIVMFAMAAFVAKQYSDNYENIQRSHNILTGAYETQITMSQLQSIQISSARGMLSEAEAMLAAVKHENEELKNLVSSIQTENSQFRNRIEESDLQLTVLQNKNVKLNGELANIKERLNQYEREIKDMKEGRAALALFRSKIRSVKRRIKSIKQDAYWTKVVAQKERDRLETLAGNNGFLVRDGMPQKPDSDILRSQKKIKVNVEFFK